MPLVVGKNRGPQNLRCPLIALCTRQAISQVGFGVSQIDAEKCIGCGKCVRSCFKQAVCEVE